MLVLIGCDYNSQKNQMNSKYPISIVYIDSLTENTLGSFPINRSYYAQLIEVIEKQNPRYIILKFFFTDSTRSDLPLIDVLQKYDNILTQATVISGQSDSDFDILSKYIIANNNFNFPNYMDAWLPYPELGKYFSGIGFVNIFVDGNVFEEFNLFNSLNNKIYPSLPLLILQMEIREETLIKKNEIEVGPAIIPINSKGSFPVDLSVPNEMYKSYSFAEVLYNNVGSQAFNNNIVIVFLGTEEAPKYIAGSEEPRNVAEILADAINTALKYLD